MRDNVRSLSPMHEPIKSLKNRISTFMGLGASDDDDTETTDVPTVFCYSLFYVYYD